MVLSALPERLLSAVFPFFISRVFYTSAAFSDYFLASLRLRTRLLFLLLLLSFHDPYYLCLGGVLSSLLCDSPYLVYHSPSALLLLYYNHHHCISLDSIDIDAFGGYTCTIRSVPIFPTPFFFSFTFLFFFFFFFSQSCPFQLLYLLFTTYKHGNGATKARHSEGVGGTRGEEERRYFHDCA